MIDNKNIFESQKSNVTLYKTVKKTLYVEKAVDGTEKKLTLSDSAKINMYKQGEKNNLLGLMISPYLTASLNSTTIAASQTKTIYELTLFVSVWETSGSGNVGYVVTGRAGWSGLPSIFTSDSKEVSDGDDSMVFSII